MRDMAGKARKKRTERTPKKAEWEDAFLTALRNSGIVRAACQAAGVARTTVYERRAEHPSFAEAWDEALSEAVELLEAAAWQRAAKGTTREKGVYYRGKPIATEKITEYSDTLLIFLLKAHKPGMYRDHVTSTNFNVDLKDLTDEQLERIAAGEDPLKVVRS